MTIKAVAFDIGGVLERVGDPDFMDEWRERLGYSIADFDRRLATLQIDDLVGVGGLSEREYQARYATALSLSGRQADEFFADMWDWYCGELDGEIADYAASLRPEYSTAIISNSADGARREEQERYGFEQLVDVVIYSHEVGVAKPDPQIYQIACRALRVQPDELAFLDDTLPIVEAARELGIHAIHHTDTATSIEALDALLDRDAE